MKRARAFKRTLVEVKSLSESPYMLYCHRETNEMVEAAIIGFVFRKLRCPRTVTLSLGGTWMTRITFRHARADIQDGSYLVKPRDGETYQVIDGDTFERDYLCTGKPAVHVWPDLGLPEVLLRDQRPPPQSSRKNWAMEYSKIYI